MKDEHTMLLHKVEDTWYVLIDEGKDHGGLAHGKTILEALICAAKMIERTRSFVERFVERKSGPAGEAPQLEDMDKRNEW